MPFCSKCGKSVNPTAQFCPACGFRRSVNVAPQPAPQPIPVYQPDPQPVSRPVPGGVQYSTVPGPYLETFNRRFAAVKVRYRCDGGHVFDGSDSQTACPTCGAPLKKGGFIQIYRMGNMMGCAVGMGIYIDSQPFGHLGNKESVRVSVPFGQHQVHLTHTATRASNMPVVTVTPEAPYAFCKASFAKAGFEINIAQASPDDMPER